MWPKEANRAERQRSLAPKNEMWLTERTSWHQKMISHYVADGPER